MQRAISRTKQGVRMFGRARATVRMCVVLVMQLDERSLLLPQERCCVISGKSMPAVLFPTLTCRIVARIGVVSSKRHQDFTL